jgi:hypothetical protein
VIFGVINNKGNSVAWWADRLNTENCNATSMDRYVGDGFSDGTLKGAYLYSHQPSLTGVLLGRIRP